ncbi:MAG: leucine--tRNA ligase [Bdellovibrionales bacterium]|nr:leucine--tRNA ligase [Bdellovibrionales bacterium]
MAFDHKTLEQKWQKKWEENKCFKAEVNFNKPKFYALSMFPYPSGSGLHIGHLASYTPTEIVARFKRSQGFNVLHPMGYDAFGLPAEQYAIQTGIHPSVITQQAIDNFRRQLKSFGYSFDWDREVSTCEPDYYKWTQFLFIQFLKKGLAYQKKVPVNWCPALRTILANEEVIDGKSERGGHPVIKKPIKQWLLAITKYAEKLLQDMTLLQWPERTIEGQKNWIGKSPGAFIFFPIKNAKKNIEVFTTRPDTLFGVTFMVLSPEHPLTEEITTKEQKKAVLTYKEKTLRMSDVDRKASENKTGVFTGAYAIHPFTKEEIPMWIADYVLMDYGTGAIMAVPAHDERDFEFAKNFKLPIKKIMECEKLPFTEDSLHIQSDFLNGLNKEEAIKKTISEIEKNNYGKQETQYKLKDWIFSRQRYWGEPFPVVHFKDKIKAIDEKDLPVILPQTTHYEPSEKGESPLARHSEFINYTDPQTGEKGRREDSTMPGYAASSWYFLRYTDPKNKQAPFDFEKQKYWMPVDLYVGGAEHTVGHLLYARFWQKFLYDMKMVSHKEPFKKLIHQGMILGEDGQKMSKSRGNTANPDSLKDKYGADTIRVYITFLGPLEKDKPWSSQGIEGSRRFLERVWRLCFNDKGEVLPEIGQMSQNMAALLNRTIKKVTEDIESLNLNTAISAMMVLVNELYRKQVRNHKTLKILAQLLMPFAPHIAEEIWSALGGEGFVSLNAWPAFQKELIKEKEQTIGVQVNGKTRSSITCSNNTSESVVLEAAKEKTAIQNALKGKIVKKVIYKAGRILNIITN